MGKGAGFCMYPFDSMGDMEGKKGNNLIRGSLICVCCLLLAAVGLLLGGLLLFMAPNDHAAQVKEWNAAMKNYTTQTVPYIEEANMTFPSKSHPLALVTDVVTPLGSSKGLDNDGHAVSYSWTTGSKTYLRRSSHLDATIDSRSFAEPLVGNANVGAGIFNFTLDASASYGSIKYEIKVTCPKATKKTCSSDTIKKMCYAAMPAAHKNNVDMNCSLAEVSNFYGSASAGNSRTCLYYGRVEEICTPVKLQPGGVDGNTTTLQWVLPGNNVTSCDFPFTTQRRTCDRHSSYSSYAPFIFMSINDPHIILSNMTNGTMSFGLTASEAKATSLAMLAIGVLLLLCFVCLCVSMRALCCCTSNPERHPHKAAVYTAMGQHYEHEDYQPVDHGGGRAQPMKGGYGAV